MKLTHGLFVILAASLLAACPAKGSGTVVVGGGGGGGTLPPDRPPPRPTGPVWDSNGWTLLGSQDVNGAMDHDTITVGKQEGVFDVITMVVADSDLALNKMLVTFGNKTTFDVPTKFVFGEGQRTRVIDLPGENRFIAKIDLWYQNIPGGGRARVEVYGKKVKDTKPVEPPPPPPPPTEPGFDPTGWKLIGTQSVDGKKDRDLFPVGKEAGVFDEITVVVTDSDLELLDFIVTFGNGKKFDPKFRHLFTQGSRSKVIDLPKQNRFIKHIDVVYKNLAGGGAAKIEIYARKVKDAKGKGGGK